MTKVVTFPDRHRIAEEAAEWLVRLDSERPPTADELEALGGWLARSPAHREELERLAGLWNRMNIMTELAVPLTRAAAASPGRPRDEQAGRRPTWRWSNAAMGLMVLSAVAMAAVFLSGDDAPLPLAASQVYETGVGQQSTVVLSDGSTVVLNTNSRINVNYDSRYRNVYLSRGEALFTVAKLRDLPFRVYAGNGRIEALGTAFAVRLHDQFVKVMVSEGRVSFASATLPQPGSADPASPVGPDPGGSSPDSHEPTGDAFRTVGRLGAGEVVTIYANAELAAPGELAMPAIGSVSSAELDRQLAWSDGVLLFSGDTLDNVVKELGRYTTVHIEIPDAELRKMRVGGRFPIGETEAMLAALEANFNLSVQRSDQEHVILTSVTD
jgi:transmembrane sensor